MMLRLIGFVCLFLCTGCNEGSSLMKNYNVDDASKGIITKLGKTLASNDLSNATSLINSEGFDIDTPDKDGKTLLIALVLSEDYQNAEKILQLGANPNLLHDDYRSKSAIGWAAAYKDNSYLKLLLQYGADINLYNSKQRATPYPLYNAIAADRHSNLKFLLSNGADPNVIDKAGLTPLMFTATSGSWEMALILLEAGADITFKNRWGEDAASYIEDAGLGTKGEANQWRKKVVKFFESKGVKLDLRVAL